MKHVKEKMKDGEVVHFLHSINHSLCGNFMKEDAEFTRKKVNCGRCINLVELAKKVDEKEYV